MTFENLNKLAEQGIFFADDVIPENISDSAVFLPGCRISGTLTSIGPDCVIGSEAPVTIENCQLARNVKLKGGYFAGSVFFDGSNMGSGAHIRAGTILEEEAGGAHTVGMKQTIFLPYVTAGSLINFCDVLMSGGTSRKDHSEIGSSYIHFNYTPHQDKATASLVGDVPNGVFMDQDPIFLGGQGGLVGPARITFGSVVAAGGICRQDITKNNQLLIPGMPPQGERSYKTGVYRKVDRIVNNGMAYIGNIAALREWYRHVRNLFIRDTFDEAVLTAGIKNLELILAERIKRLDQLADNMDYSIEFLAANSGNPQEIKIQKEFACKWPEMKSAVENMEFSAPENFLKELTDTGSYIESIQSLTNEQRESGRKWLQAVVNNYANIWSYI